MILRVGLIRGSLHSPTRTWRPATICGESVKGGGYSSPRLFPANSSQGYYRLVGWWKDALHFTSVTQTESNFITPVPVIWYCRQIKVFSWISSFQHQWLGFHCCSKSNHTQSWNSNSHRYRLDLTHCFGVLSTCLCIYCLSSFSELFSISSLKWLLKICVFVCLT